MSDIFDLTDTWNNGATTFTAIRMNVTDSASQNASLLIDLQRGGTSQFRVDKFGAATGVSLRAASTTQNFFTASSNSAQLKSDAPFSWSNSSTNSEASRDTGLYRNAAAIIGVRGGDTTTGGALNFLEQTAPAAPSANQVVLYAEDNGSGKTRLMARFPTGAAQQVAIEP